MSERQHYLIIVPAVPLVTRHAGTADEEWSARIVLAATLRLDPPGLDVDLSELFEAG